MNPDKTPESGKKVKRKKLAKTVKRGSIYARIAVQILIILLLLYSVWGIGSGMLESAVEGANIENVADAINDCDRFYYQGAYAGLYRHMNLFDLEGDEYGMYTEIVNGVLTSHEYLIWSRLDEGDMKLVDPDGRTSLSAMQEKYALQLKQNAADCKFNLNQNVLNQLAEAADSQ